jgi:alpha/beta superfamily hydrolase
LVHAVDWLSYRRQIRGSLGLFGASTGAAAALIAAAVRPGLIEAVVSRGGRADLAASALRRVVAPTLLIVGSEDDDVLALNHEAAAQIKAVHELRIVAGATHLFEERGKLEEVAALAAGWFEAYLHPHEAAQAASAR